MAHGLPYEEGMKGLTLYPAQIFGVDELFGSLEIGKAADVILFDGDPLKDVSRVTKVFIDGRMVVDDES